MGSKIRKFFDRFTRNSNEEIDELLHETFSLNEKIDQLQAGTNEELAKLEGEINKNYHNSLVEKRNYETKTAHELEVMRQAFDTHRREMLNALRVLAEVLTNPKLNIVEQKKELGKIL